MSVTVVIERAALVLIAMASIAHAQAPNPADAAFKRGRELVAAGRHADACIEFEHSQKLDPAKGTAYNIALCSEKTGKLARALQLCRELAATDTKVDRKKVVVEMIPKLEARVPHLVIKAPTPPLGFLLTITPINGHPRSFEANKPIEMDLGEYTITAKASGVTPWSQTVRIVAEGKTTTLEVPFAKSGPPTAAPPSSPAATVEPSTTATAQPIVRGPIDEPAPAKSRRKLYGIVGMGAGGASVVTGLVFGFQAKNKWNDAKEVCDDGTVCTTSMKLRDATELRVDAKNKALLSTIFVGAGVAVATVGVVLYVTAPSSESQTRVTARPTHDGGAITLSGRF